MPKKEFTPNKRGEKLIDSVIAEAPNKTKKRIMRRSLLPAGRLTGLDLRARGISSEFLLRAGSARDTKNRENVVTIVTGLEELFTRILLAS